MEREVCAILEPFGVPSEIGAKVALALQTVEANDYARSADVERSQTSLLPLSTGEQGRERFGEHVPIRGLTPFLLRLGEGVEEMSQSRVWQSALTIGASYFLGGL